MALSEFNTSLRVYLDRLRGRLEPFGLKIETMVGVGYRLRPAARQQQ